MLDKLNLGVIFLATTSPLWACGLHPDRELIWTFCASRLREAVELGDDTSLVEPSSSVILLDASKTCARVVSALS